MFLKCDKCSKTIGFNEGYVSVNYNVQSIEHDPSTLQNVANFHKSTNVLTLCSNCGNQNNATAMKEMLQLKKVASQSTYPMVTISMELKGDKIEVLQHTIDPALEIVVGKDESEHYVTFDSYNVDKVLAFAKVTCLSELRTELRKSKSLSKFKVLLDHNKIPYESITI